MKKTLALSKFVRASIVVCKLLVDELIERLNKKCGCRHDGGDSLACAMEVHDQLTLLGQSATKYAALSAANVCILLARTVSEIEATPDSWAIETLMSRVYDSIEAE